jgi:hypothetical protein
MNYSKDLLNQSCKNTVQNIKVFEVSYFFLFESLVSIQLILKKIVHKKCDGKDYLDKVQELNSHSIIFLNIPRYFD